MRRGFKRDGLIGQQRGAAAAARQSAQFHKFSLEIAAQNESGDRVHSLLSTGDQDAPLLQNAVGSPPTGRCRFPILPAQKAGRMGTEVLWLLEHLFPSCDRNKNPPQQVSRAPRPRTARPVPLRRRSVLASVALSANPVFLSIKKRHRKACRQQRTLC